jgi:hypothetical protein
LGQVEGGEVVEQAAMIRQYIIWRTNHVYDERLRRVIGRDPDLAGVRPVVVGGPAGAAVAEGHQRSWPMLLRSAVSSVTSHAEAMLGHADRPSPRSGSTLWKHPQRPQVSHQKRRSLLEARVRETNT